MGCSAAANLVVLMSIGTSVIVGATAAAAAELLVCIREIPAFRGCCWTSIVGAATAADDGSTCTGVREIPA